ncbi:hypothetical protein Tco_0048529, partial [Tanacetum coccineum]
MNFKGTEEVISLTQWLEKMESVFYISNYTVACQVKFAPCTLQESALTWWNSHVRTFEHDIAYAMPWKTLKKIMTDKYCPRGKIKKQTEMMFPEELDEVEKQLKSAIELMDKKISTIAKRQAENKRKFEDTLRNNQNQQQPLKRNNMARAYTTGPRKKKPYGGSKPLQPATANNNQRAQGADQRVLTCFKCGAHGHFRSNYLKLKNSNQGNQAGNGHDVARAYVVGTAGTNPNSNVVMDTFFLNNHYALILFDTGA